MAASLRDYEMLEIFDVDYKQLKTKHSEELFRLRKTTFHDRLGWDVLCSQGMESDEFDVDGTRYILGMYSGTLLCSVRFIKLSEPNMITHTFSANFNQNNLPELGVESSRFFVDKMRTRELLGEKFPTSQLLFLAMANWSQNEKYNCIHTIVSRPMLTILRRSGWQLNVIQEAYLSEKERIYLVSLPTGKNDQLILAQGVTSRTGLSAESLLTWPFRLPV